MSYYLHCMTSRVKFGSTAGELGSSLHTHTHTYTYTDMLFKAWMTLSSHEDKKAVLNWINHCPCPGAAAKKASTFIVLLGW